MKLRRFNDQGVSEFGAFLDVLRSSADEAVPVGLLNSARFSEPLGVTITANPPPSFANRMAFANWLHTAATDSGENIPRNDAGFWAWLSLALFDHICPADGNGRRKPGANPRYIIDAADWKRRYRHLLQNPYDVYFLHRDDPGRALVALVNPLDQPGELTEQINGRQELVTCPGCMSLATFLCIDANGKRRKGASGDFARVFGKAVNRVSRTFDLPEMPPPLAAKLLHQRKLRKLVEAAVASTPET
jgi:hypothetical protein